MHEEISLIREVDAIQIPSGDTITLPAGTPVYITQRLGGTFTVATSAGLARISSTDADALGIDLEAEKQKQAAAHALKDAPLEEQVWAQLKSVYDPEIPVNIYDLGLIYGVEINGGHAMVTMTLTTPHCPVAESMPGEVELRVGAVPGIGDAEVNLVWDPPWGPDKMTDEARLELGML